MPINDWYRDLWEHECSYSPVATSRHDCMDWYFDSRAYSPRFSRSANYSPGRFESREYPAYRQKRRPYLTSDLSSSSIQLPYTRRTLGVEEAARRRWDSSPRVTSQRQLLTQPLDSPFGRYVHDDTMHQISHQQSDLIPRPKSSNVNTAPPRRPLLSAAEWDGEGFRTRVSPSRDFPSWDSPRRRWNGKTFHPGDRRFRSENNGWMSPGLKEQGMSESNIYRQSQHENRRQTRAGSQDWEFSYYDSDSRGRDWTQPGETSNAISPENPLKENPYVEEFNRKKYGVGGKKSVDRAGSRRKGVGWQV